jgi:hypothetical protein
VNFKILGGGNKMKYISLDPGSKNFAYVVIEGNKVKKMGYFKTVSYFEINRERIKLFSLEIKGWARKVDYLVVERYVGWRGSPASTEKINTMIGIITNIFLEEGKDFKLFTASSWKRRIPYKKLMEKTKEMDYLRKDDHFIDCILLWCSYIGYTNYLKILKQGEKIYGEFRKAQRLKN